MRGKVRAFVELAPIFAMEEIEKKWGHIIMVPFMAHGHLIPFLALAKRIKERKGLNINITIATIHLNIQYLQSAIPPPLISTLFSYPLILFYMIYPPTWRTQKKFSCLTPPNLALSL
ncbi:hypothetical protein VNO77_30040 [Canavalia gladiata]|uniref:Uncharacterized protein n=1 Tax=Canavalia gladiata TaxID=3824 RepID=A0AAN9KP29_CANGL